jgi:UDP:flavonoid glycosyltransferase YjiC (YdhE family)
VRVLLTALAPTHYFHLVPLAWALRAAGHEVRVAAQPPVVDAITRSGMIAVELDDSYEFMANGVAAMRLIEERIGPLPADFGDECTSLPVDAVHWVQFTQLEVVVKTAASVAADLVAFARWWRPDLVVTDPLAFAAPLAAEAVGAPLVRHLWGPGVPGAGIPPEYWLKEQVDLFARYGVEPRADYASCNVDPCPTSLQIEAVPDRLPMRFVPYNGPGTLPDWLRRPRDRPRVCLTMGMVRTGMRGTNRALGADFLTALAAQDVDVVAALSASDREVLGDPPAGVRVVSGVPLHLLLPSCDAVIHHGGASTALTAVSQGVPQVVADAEPDDHLMAQALVGAGIGVSLRTEELDADGFVAAVASVLADESVRLGADRLRDENGAAPPPAEAVQALEKLLS